MKRALNLSLFITIFVTLFVILVTTSALAQTNPVPLVNLPLRPSAISPGGAGFTLTVTGANFVSGATVNWNGSPRTTTFVSSSKLTAAITAVDVAHAQTALVTVVNPVPGGGASNVAYLPVHAKFAAGAFARRDTVLTSGVQGSSLTQVGDFNNDGKLDVANICGSTICMFLGNGDGTFESVITSSGSLEGLTLTASGDVNNDGKLDLIAADIFGSYYSYLGNGDGTFNQTPVQWGGWPGGIVFADLNRDGNLDVINEGAQEGAAGTNSQLGNGSGTFTQKWNGTAIYNQSAGFCAIADFNHDGKLDIACPGGPNFGNGVQVAFGNGDGTFGTPTEYSTPAVGFTVLAVDVNKDGKLDLITDGGWVLLGKGDGTFITPSGPSFSPVAFPSVVDINADGKLDIVGSKYNVAASGVNAIATILGNGDGTFQSPILSEASWGDGNIAFGDFNNDGKLDAVTFAQDLITKAPIMSVLLQTNLAISQTIISFGPVKVGTSSTQTSVLTNIGASTLTLGSIGGSLGPSFVVTSDCGTSLAPGTTCSVTLTFSPKKTGSLTGTVHVGYSGTVGTPQYIEMSGLGN